jgi:membrane fusion protein
MSDLFRAEVLAEQKTQWLGPVLLAPRPSHHVFAAFGAATIAAVLALIAFGSFPRKVRVSGSVVPEAGLMQVYARQIGTITDVSVTEGAEVKKGDRLATLSSDVQAAGVGAAGEHVARQLAARKQSLIEDRRNVERLSEQQKKALEDKLAALETTETALKGQYALQGARLASARKTVVRQKQMLKEAIASGEHVQQAEESQLEQAAKLRELEVGKASAERDRISLEAELADLPLKLERDRASIDREIAVVDEEIAQLAAQREPTLTAPADGIVTALVAKPGLQADPKTALLAVAPKGSPLEAQIMCPSSAIGFLKIGQKVLVRYEAFPYQKFGHFEGHIANISRSAVVTDGNATQYRVDVRLAEQSVRAFGRNEPLQPGMQLEADVVLENRRLIEWMLEPLFTVSGTWKH